MKIYIEKMGDSSRAGQKQTGQRLLEKIAGMKGVPVVYGKQGKPYIKENPWYFNISHSEEYLLFVQGKYEIGADIQKVSPCNMERIAEKCYTDEEKGFLGQADTPEEKLRRFYKIWCRKEAYGKYLGCGLTTSVFKKNTLDLLDTIDFREYDILEGYCMCICCKKEEEREETVHIFEGL